MNKRSLSAVITTIIIILLVLVAVGIVWIVVRNVIEQGAEDVSLERFTIDLDLESVTVQVDGNISVKVKRGTGKGNLTGINIILSDGKNSQIIEKGSIEQLETKTFAVTRGELTEIYLVKKVSIAPVFETSPGKTESGNVIDEQELSGEDTLKILNIIRWWKLDGNAADEINSNDGTINGADCNIQGKFEKSCSFDGVDDYVSLPSAEISAGSFTTAIWIKRIVDAQSYQTIIGNNNQRILIASGGSLLAQIGNTGNFFSTQSISNNEWTHVIYMYDSETNKAYFYINGEYDNEHVPSPGTPTWNGPFYIGQDLSGNYKFYGTIDELMIFNRALSENEIKSLYQLDLN